MAQIIPFTPTAASYPTSTTRLDAAERAFLIAIRWWVSAFRRGEDPMPHLCRHCDTVGARDAAYSVDALVAIVARTVRHPIAIHCAYCPHLSADEMHLLHAASLVQAGDSGLAERALRAALLSASGAEFALGPLQGLGKLFVRARLLFSRRRSPADALSRAGIIETWSPSIRAPTVH
jgi:hypothetical protein